MDYREYRDLEDYIERKGEENGLDEDQIDMLIEKSNNSSEIDRDDNFPSFGEMFEHWMKIVDGWIAEEVAKKEKGESFAAKEESREDDGFDR